jgi:hypothetical protein
LPFPAVSTLPPLTWSDLGTPQRVFKLLRTRRSSPAWMRGRWPGLVPPGESAEGPAAVVAMPENLSSFLRFFARVMPSRCS